MSLTISLLIKLFAPTLARAILTATLGDKVSGGDIAETLTDSLDLPGLLAWLTNDYKAQRSGERLFAQVGDEAAESLAIVFASEGAALAEAQQAEVARAAASTLEKHALPLLLAHNLRAGPFETALLAVAPPAWLHRQEHDLYRRVLVECSRRIFALADKLPHFSRDTTSQLLQRTSHLQEDMAAVLATMSRIYETSQANNPEQAAATFERDYRLLLARELDRLTLFGAASVGDYRQPLTAAYLPPRLMLHRGDDAADERAGAGRAASGPERSLTAPEMLASGKRLLLVGRAGAGKTTLLKWVAVQAARQDFAAEAETLPGWQEKIPFFLRLRDFAQKPLPTFDRLPAYAPGVAELADRPLEAWTRQQLASGRALLLLDGLDEVSAAQRSAVYDWLERLVLLYPQATYLVTTRPPTLEDTQVAARFGRSGFARFALRDMEANDIGLFVERWHAAMADERCLLPDQEKTELPALARRLQQTLEREKKLGDLARNPLLCALLCALHQARRSQLPSDRIQLYEACLDMLLEGRDAQRGVDTGDYGVALSLRQKKRLLGELAYWMMANQQPVIDHEMAVRKLGGEQRDGAAVLRFLLARSGLLQSQSVTELDFAHRTFQEYLAAQDIDFHDNVRAVCLDHASQAEWRETIRLLGGVASRAAAQALLLQTLWEKAEQTAEATAQRQLHLLAWECFSLMAVPLAEALALARRAAAALVAEEREEETGQITYSLNVSGSAVADLTPLSNLVQLQSLSLDRTAVADLSPLSNLVQLQELWLSGTAVADLTPLSNLVQLQWLNLNGTAVADLTPLTHLVQLQSLWLYGTAVADLSPLSNLVQLQTLNLGGTAVADLTPLTNLVQLPWLNLHGMAVADLTPLTNLVQLQSLDLQRTAVADLTPLTHLVQLQRLSLSGTAVADLTPLSNLVQLQSLGLGGTAVADLTPLSNLVQLQWLGLDGTAVADLTPLSNLVQLQWLGLDGTAVADLTPLSNLVQLQWLGLDGTAVADLTPLSNLTQLGFLDLRGSQVSDLSPLAQLPQLQVLDVRDTASADFAPLLALSALQALWLNDPAQLPAALRQKVTLNPAEEPWFYWNSLQQQKRVAAS